MCAEQKAGFLIEAVGEMLDECPDRRTLAVLEGPVHLENMARDHNTVREPETCRRVGPPDGRGVPALGEWPW